MRNWYSIKNLAATDVLDISIHEEIGFWGVTAKEFIADLKQSVAPKVALSINSPGGSVFDAIAIVNALRASGKEITVTVMGIAASAASYIAMAGDKIVMPENTWMMVHNPINGVYGNADDMREMADLLDKMGASLAATYAKRTGKSQEEVQALLDNESYLTAAECLEHGLCDEVVPAVEAVAAFAIDRLPENIKSAFEAAKAKAEAPPPAPKEPTHAERVTALATEAGFEAHAATWALSCKDVTEVAARIADAREIVALCEVAKQPEAAAKFIKAAKSVDDVRAELVAALADKDEHVDTSTKQPSGPSPTAHPAASAVTTSGIWEARNKQRNT